MRGGRMIKCKYLCTFDLFSSIPTLDSIQSVTEEIFAWKVAPSDFVIVTLGSMTEASTLGTMDQPAPWTKRRQEHQIYVLRQHQGSHGKCTGRKQADCLTESNSLVSIVSPHQPHFLGQP